ncbi:xanthine dehydrogenase family protein molybdopterin-binding subunit [Candidatus Binatus sp.]|uniref:xanthine dehydrogenase family protein molybdopterin-binding subunit n=1 Tax=Candidatus Binatus sp. TaxID=2811406 RepID=UPI003BAEEED2
MSRRVTLNLGFQGNTQDITVVIPDDEPTPWQWGDRLSVVGKPTPRVDGPLKVTGAAHYTYDIELPGMLSGAILRSPWPHARIRNIDVSAAQNLAGVRAVLALDDREIRFAGQEVAAVAAISSDIAADALKLIKVDYETLPFVVDMDAAAKDSAPSVFRSGSNVGKTKNSSVGDVPKGLEIAASTIEATYTTPVQTHVCLETHGAVASFNAAGDQLTVWCSTQGIFSVRDDLAVYFSLPPDSVRVVCEYLGGGFGSKFGATPEIIVASRLAKRAGVPVKVMLPRADEHRSTGNRPNSEQKVKMGVDRDGKLIAIDLVTRGSGGIGGGAGSAGPFGSVYRCANIRVQETGIYTNAGPSSPMRAPGWPQGCFALELAMDEMARKAGIDRLEFRRRNSDNPVRAAEYEIGARMFGWAEKNEAAKSSGPIKRGVGVASAEWHAVGVSGPEAQVIAHRDGSVEVRVGTQDIGTGTRTVLAIVAAEELGLPVDRVKSEIGDTRFLFSVPSGGSLSAPSNSPAVRQAAAHLKDKLFRIAAPILGAEPDDLEAADEMIRVRASTSRAISFTDVCKRIPGDSISAQGERVPNYGGFRSDQAGCQFAEVEVDTETGIIRVKHVVAVHDAGRIIDPLTARSQVNGGILMGIGFALFEDRRMDPQLGIMVNPTMDDYKLLGALDVPQIDVTFFEVANGVTNTGVMGLGEVSHVASTAAVACAVYDAIGVPVRSLPMTPDRVLAALGHV